MTHERGCDDRTEEPVVLAAESLRQCERARDHPIKHSAQGRAIDRTWLHSEADDSPAN